MNQQIAKLMDLRVMSQKCALTSIKIFLPEYYMLRSSEFIVITCLIEDFQKSGNILRIIYRRVTGHTQHSNIILEVSDGELQ